MFLRKTRIEPLPVTMSAVRMGERVLQVGVDDAAIATAIAAKAGLSGNAALVVSDERDASRAREAFARAGILVDVRTTPLESLPFEDNTFDLIVVHAMSGALPSIDPGGREAAMLEWKRVLRHGGRVMTIEAGPPTGLIATMFNKAPRPPAFAAAGGVVNALQAAGFRPVRLLAEREGYRFAEGIKS
jgi:ubiquinone/menaquinone biosynthesis C-methylase UbiE